MAIELQHSDVEDPFRDCSFLSLLPQTLGALLNAEAAASEAQELDSIQHIFKSMALKGSTQLQEQAQTIDKSYSNIQSLYSEDGNKAFAANGKDCPQGRRPALGRKRAQFSLKPISSHSLPNVDVSSSIDHIEDPEEYFMAFEQLENAEKELKKLRGEILTDPTQHHQSTTARKRRLGLLGKTASYKHHFSANADTAEALVESQEEPPDRRISSPSKTLIDMELSNALHSKAIDEPGTSQTKNTDSELQDAMEREGSVADKEKKVDKLLEKLLSSFKDLDGDEGETLLRESLQMKSIDVGKICLPESILRIDHFALNHKVTRGKLKGSQFPQSSPTLTKSPLAAISTLQRRVSLKDPLKDLYSIPPGDDAPYSGDSSRSRGLDRESLSPPDIDNRDKSGLVVGEASSPVVENGTQLSFEDKMHSPVLEADRFIGHKITSEDELTEHPPLSLEKNVDHDSSGVDNDKNIVSNGLDGDLQEEGNDMQLEPLITDQTDAGVEGPTSGCINHSRTEGLATPRSRNMDENHSGSGINVDTGLSGLDDTSQAEVNATVQEKVLDAEASEDGPSPSKATLLMDQHLENFCTLTEENNEGHQTASGASLNRVLKQKAPLRRRNKHKSISRRQSLADAGMVWKSGVRKSSRIKSRPLQYWRGERFLYGRIHDSLATVIGVKYASPGKDGKEPMLKVKSFVSDEYADLVAQAALH